MSFQFKFKLNLLLVLPTYFESNNSDNRENGQNYWDPYQTNFEEAYREFKT